MIMEVLMGKYVKIIYEWKWYENGGFSIAMFHYRRVLDY